MMQRSFIYEPNGGRILFGAGSLHRLPIRALIARAWAGLAPQND
jgi:hypothetical protein